MKPSSLLWVVAVAGMIGCGGTGTGTTDFTTSGTATGGTTTSGGGTTGGTTGSLIGEYLGTFAGSNTSVISYTGTGDASITSDGFATFHYDAHAGIAPVSNTFIGTLTTDGAFSGSTLNGTDATGTAQLTGTTLTVQITWTRASIGGGTPVVSTENFTLTKQ